MDNPPNGTFFFTVSCCMEYRPNTWTQHSLGILTCKQLFAEVHWADLGRLEAYAKTTFLMVLPIHTKTAWSMQQAEPHCSTAGQAMSSFGQLLPALHHCRPAWYGWMHVNRGCRCSVAGTHSGCVDSELATPALHVN